MKAHPILPVFEVLKSLAGRYIRGIATELVAGSANGLATMHARPEIAFRCGPMALDQVYGKIIPSRPNRKLLLDAKSTRQGTSLWQNYQWPMDAEIPLRPAFREAGAEIPLLSVVH